ncbi:MAG: DUF4393 domain-containing protein [Acidaminococcaceae bacterium]|nr:DUF4393 domain-containing protein [Acidaminococcaceae bacterium]
MSDSNIPNLKLHKIIDSTKKALPETASAVDHALSSVLNIVGYPTNYVSEYAKYSISKLQKKLNEKLSNTSSDKVVSPPVHIAAPILEKSRFTADCEELHSMFASLLATSMNYDTQSLAHPAFIRIIEELSPLEAKILTNENFDRGYNAMASLRIQEKRGSSMFFKNPLSDDYRWLTTGHSLIEHMMSYQSLNDLSVEQLVLSSSITNNFNRLGIFEFPSGIHVSSIKRYETLTAAIKNYIDVCSKREKLPANLEYAIIPEAAVLTEFGRRFIAACVR